MIWMDLDGVFVQCNRALCEVFNAPYPTNTVFYRDWFQDTYGGDQNLRQIFERAHLNDTFWESMQPTRLCSAMVAFLDEHAPDWGILTSAWRHPQCYAGKFEWVQKNLGKDCLGRLVIVSGHKERLAKPVDLLTDDRHDICKAWNEAGGKSFQWAEYSEDMTLCLDAQFENWTQAVIQHQQSHK